MPGLGHHVHKDGDPRTPRLFEIAREEGQFGPHLALFEAIGRVHPEVLGKTLPLNGAGVCGAALADLGLPLELLRGFALLARTAGLIGQLAEELRHPVANDIFLSVDLNNRPVDPDPLPRHADERQTHAAGHRGQHHRAREAAVGHRARRAHPRAADRRWCSTSTTSPARCGSPRPSGWPRSSG